MVQAVQPQILDQTRSISNGIDQIQEFGELKHTHNNGKHHFEEKLGEILD